MDQILLKLWEIMRAKVVHEDTWIQQRVTWLMAATALLVAAYASLVRVDPDWNISRVLLRGYLLLLVPLTGFLLTGLVFVGLISSALAIEATLSEWKKLPVPEAERGLMPSLHSSGWARGLGRGASWGICILFLMIWALLFALAILQT